MRLANENDDHQAKRITGGRHHSGNVPSVELLTYFRDQLDVNILEKDSERSKDGVYKKLASDLMPFECPAFWHDGHFNGADDVDMMVRDYTPAQAKNEQMERMQRDHGEMKTPNGGGKWKSAAERLPEDLWPASETKDKGEQEQRLGKQWIRMDEKEKPECPRKKKRRQRIHSSGQEGTWNSI
ncbi:hypothetical protein CYMTET_14139 [Cymbomonas tetramitiformis]|uniref:Uncharacterized protein n=1 Tax=Cymbomonas tetramitiformis TaxID=36881 RepID=A0AAE0GH64_9CHLO|nr:hypothetical protein CYMTET_14139 [Cymbomonas tetramitiformis]